MTNFDTVHNQWSSKDSMLSSTKSSRWLCDWMFIRYKQFSSPRLLSREQFKWEDLWLAVTFSKQIACGNKMPRAEPISCWPVLFKKGTLLTWARKRGFNFNTTVLQKLARVTIWTFHEWIICSTVGFLLICKNVTQLTPVFSSHLRSQVSEVFFLRWSFLLFKWFSEPNW